MELFCIAEYEPSPNACQKLHQGDQSSCQYDLPSAFPGLEFTLWAYTLTPTADTSATWSEEGSKAGLDIEMGLTLFYCTTQRNEIPNSERTLRGLTLSFRRLHSAPGIIG